MTNLNTRIAITIKTQYLIFERKLFTFIKCHYKNKSNFSIVFNTAVQKTDITTIYGSTLHMIEGKSYIFSEHLFRLDFLPMNSWLFLVSDNELLLVY